eukprot:4196491-Alexandrium_andersonii.AAC.1
MLETSAPSALAAGLPKAFAGEGNSLLEKEEKAGNMLDWLVDQSAEQYEFEPKPEELEGEDGTGFAEQTGSDEKVHGTLLQPEVGQCSANHEDVLN